MWDLRVNSFSISKKESVTNLQLPDVHYSNFWGKRKNENER